jgi:hypothetical protein
MRLSVDEKIDHRSLQWRAPDTRRNNRPLVWALSGHERHLVGASGSLSVAEVSGAVIEVEPFLRNYLWGRCGQVFSHVRAHADRRRDPSILSPTDRWPIPG